MDKRNQSCIIEIVFFLHNDLFIFKFYRKNKLIRQIMFDSGPLDEIKYWRKQVVQLNHIMSQLRLPRHRAVIYLLNIAASPCSIVCIRNYYYEKCMNILLAFKEWKEIDKKLTESINEARDHYKYLMIINKHIGPLYRHDPVN